GRLLGDNLHGVLVKRDGFLDGADVLLLLALRIRVDAIDRMYHVFGGELLAVVLTLDTVLEMEGPDILVGFVDLPALCQHAAIIALAVVIEPETAVDLAPDGVAHRYAVGIRVVAGDRLGHADGDLASSLGVSCKTQSGCASSRCHQEQCKASCCELHLDLPTTRPSDRDVARSYTPGKSAGNAAIPCWAFVRRQPGATIRPKLFLSARSEDVTGDTVAAVEDQARLLLGAALERERAARMKAASGRRIDRARHIALQHGARAPARGIGERHGGEQRPRIGVLASAMKLSGGGDLDDLAEIHHRHAIADVLDHPQVMGDEQEGETE